MDYQWLAVILFNAISIGVQAIQNFMGNCVTRALSLKRANGDMLEVRGSQSTVHTNDKDSVSSVDEFQTSAAMSRDCISMEPNDPMNVGFMLHEAIVQNDVELCNKLLDLGFPVNTPLVYPSSVSSSSSSSGHSSSTEDKEFLGPALHIALIYRRPEIVNLLLEHFANPDLLDKFGRTTLFLTVSYWPRMQLKDCCPPEFTDYDYYQEYLRRLHSNSATCLESLCECNADVNQPSGVMQETPLHAAAKYHITTCANMLLSHGADANARDAQGMTPLHYTCSHPGNRDEQNDLMQLLAENGALINAKDTSGLTALHVAAMNGCDCLIQQLLALGADPDCQTDRGLTPLYLLLDDVRNIFCISGLSSILNATTYLRIFDENHQLPALLKLPAMRGIKKALLAASSHPPPLFLICVRTVQKTIGRQNISEDVVQELPCPNLFKHRILNEGNHYYSNWNEFYCKK